MDGLDSNPDLRGQASPRVMPRIGEWGPSDVPTTRQKLRQRWLTVLALVAVVIALTAFGYLAWLQLRG